MAIQTDMTYDGSSNTDWARSFVTTLRETWRDELHEMMRSYKILTSIERRGNIETNVSGRGMDRPVQYRLHNVSDNDGTTPRTFAPANLWKVANIEYRGYQATDSITKKERKENRGKNALIPLLKNMKKRLQTSIMETIANQVYIDGEATGNTKKFHGLNSMFGVSNNGTADIGYDHRNATAMTENPLDGSTANDELNIVMVPSDTFYGLSTVLGNYGGSMNSGTWPDGVCDPQFDFWSPLMINVNSDFFTTAAGASVSGWDGYPVEHIRYGLTHCRRNKLEEQVDTILMDRTIEIKVKNKLLSGVERVIVNSDNGLRSFGFNDVFQIDGVDCTTEYGIPVTSTDRGTAVNVPSAFGVPIKQMSILSMHDGLVEWDDPFYDIDTQSTKFVGDILGNFWLGSPRGYIKWYEAGAVGA